MCAQEELKRDLLQMRQEKERAQAAAAARTQLQHTHGNSSQHHYTTVTSAHKRKREEEREPAMKSKKKKMISTTSTKESKKDTKLYCICKTPYDETKYDTVASNATQNHTRNRSWMITVIPFGKKNWHQCRAFTFTFCFSEGSTLAATCVPTGITENVWASQKRRRRRWTTTSAWSVNGVRKAAQKSSTASVKLPMMSPSKCPEELAWSVSLQHRISHRP